MDKQETKLDFCKILGIGIHFDGHGTSMVFESRMRLSKTTTRERWASHKLESLPPAKPPNPNGSLLKGGFSSDPTTVNAYCCHAMFLGQAYHPKQCV